MISRGRLQSVSHRKRKKQRLKIRSIIWSVALVFILVSLIAVTHLKAVRISHIYPVGNKLLSNDEVIATVKGELAGSYLYLFPKDNIIYFPRRTIEQKFLKDHLEVSSVNVSFKNFQSITVAFKEREPAALACKSASSGSSCFFIDFSGYVFKEAPTFGLDSTYLVFVGSDASTTLGSKFIEPTELANIRSFVDLLKKQQIQVSSVSIKDGGVREASLSTGGTIIWNADEDLGLAYQNLLLLISSSKFDGKNPDGSLNVEYIDLQNQNKIFYKLRGAK